MKKVSVILFIYFICSIILNAQKVTIVVVDSLTREPISYASASFIETNSGTYTNDYGVLNVDSTHNFVLISHVGYYSKKLERPFGDDTIKLRPQIYSLVKIIVKPGKKKTEEIGYIHHKSDFVHNGFSGDELAVYFPNRFDNTKSLKELSICFDINRHIKEYLGIDFVSVFKINFYSKKENSSEPDTSLLIKELVLTSNIIKPATRIDISNYNIRLPKNGLFVSVEWVGIESEKTKELITDYKGRTEPFVSTTFEKTDAIVFERNKFSSNKWTLIDKNNILCIALKKNNFFTPRISITLR